MRRISIEHDAGAGTAGSPASEAVAAAVEVLRAGGVVGLPTDTVYGLAADPMRKAATDRIFAVKGRPESVDLPVLVAGEDELEQLVERVTPAARRLVERHWPGALTLVLPRRADIDLYLGGAGAAGSNQPGQSGAGAASPSQSTNRRPGQGSGKPATVGVRCPANQVVRAVCREFGPIAATSANRHGESPFHRADDFERLAGVDLVIDAGECAGEPSTVVDLTGDEPTLLRQGGIPWAAVFETVGPRAPGSGVGAVDSEA